MAVNQRLKCSAKCGASEFDAMVEGRNNKLFIIDKTPGEDGFPINKEVNAVCVQCSAALEIRMMAFAIGGRAMATAGMDDDVDRGARRRIGLELGPVAQHVGERTMFHDCGDGGSGEAFKATVKGPLVAPKNSSDGPKLVEVGGVAVRDDGSSFVFSPGCSHDAPGSGPKGAGNN